MDPDTQSLADYNDGLKAGSDWFNIPVSVTQIVTEEYEYEPLEADCRLHEMTSLGPDGLPLVLVMHVLYGTQTSLNSVAEAFEFLDGQALFLESSEPFCEGLLDGALGSYAGACVCCGFPSVDAHGKPVPSRDGDPGREAAYEVLKVRLSRVWEMTRFDDSWHGKRRKTGDAS